MLKSLACVGMLAALSTPALAFGPTPADVAAFSAASAELRGLNETHRELASGDLTGFTEAMRRVMAVAAVVAIRDYPQLGAGWKACRGQLVTTDGGQTYHYAPAYQAACKQIDDRFTPLISQEFDALSRASAAADRAAIGNALR
jgi:hypothetical protein